MPDPAVATQIPFRAAYARAMAVVWLGGTIVAALVARALGGEGRTDIFAALAVAAGSVATFLPALLAGQGRAGTTNFGLLVLASSIARMLLILVIALVISRSQSVTERALWFGAMGGGLLILIGETAMAIGLLAKMERLKSTLPR